MKTFGAIEPSAHGEYWKIDPLPHVAILLKRLFPKISRGKRFAYLLTNTPENCNDLEWFLKRYPMEGDIKDLKKRARYYRKTMEEMEQVMAGEYTPREFKVCSSMEKREYQIRAAEVYMKNRFLLCCDDVGLGKTAIAILTFAEPDTLPAIVVTLTHLPRQWESEIKRFLPGLSIHILQKGTPYPLPEFLGNPPDVIITNYHKLAGWDMVLSKYANSIVFDEIQELRRDSSMKYGAAERIARSCKYRMGLSATPIYNYGGEFYNIANVLKENVLGTNTEFINQWGSYSYGDKIRIDDPAAFGTYCREHFIMIRRTRREVGRELPEVTKIPYKVDSDTEPIEDASTAARELAMIIMRKVESSREQRFNAGGQFDMLMRQATGIAKAPYVADFVRILLESGEKVVLYGWHRAVYSLWGERLKDYNPMWFTGSESPSRKDLSKRAFIEDGSSNLLIISLRAGAGMDGLQKVCRTVVFGELDWSPGVHEQCIGRVHRDGQLDPVMAYYLISDEGSDPIVADVLGIKREQIEGVINPDRPLVEALDRGEHNLKKLAQHFLEKGKQ